MQRFGLVWALLAAAAMAPAARAQEPGLTELYGNAVHAYFSGQTAAALDGLTTAVDAGSQDPRVFYYRGLVNLRMNLPDAADEDFARGAALEAGSSGLYGVDRALERIQGWTRMKIERQRTAARLAALRQLSQQPAGYSEPIESTRPAPGNPPGNPPGAPPAVPLEEPVQPAAPPPPAPNQATPSDPLGAPMQNPPAESEEAVPPPKPAPAQVDPFKEDDPFKETETP
jgi:hypothetical protein